MQQDNHDLGSLFTVAARDPEIKDVEHAPQLKVMRGSIRFEDVAFAYDPARLILKGISFEVQAAGGRVVGPPGAGKRRLPEPSSGVSIWSRRTRRPSRSVSVSPS